MITEKAKTFAGLPVMEWNPGKGLGENPAAFAWRIESGYVPKTRQQTPWSEELAALLAEPRVEEITALVVGNWGMAMEESSNAVVEALAAARDRLSHLTAIFLGDLTYQDCEISWIHQSDIAPLLNAYPALTHLTVRGGADLRLGISRQTHLRVLIVEGSNLEREAVQEILASEYPALEHLEIWTGPEEYGADTEIADLAPLFAENAPRRWPNLRTLALRNSELSDEIAVRLAASPLLPQLTALDFSLSTLGNAGVTALLESGALSRLQRLDIHHHYVTPPLVAQLQALGIPELNVEGAATELEFGEDDFEDEAEGFRPRTRYVAVGE
jgi:hypothetical protein